MIALHVAHDSYPDRRCVGSAILTETSLSFMGLGTAEPTPSWGLMLSGGAPMYDGMAPSHLTRDFELLVNPFGFAAAADPHEAMSQFISDSPENWGRYNVGAWPSSLPRSWGG